MGGIIILNKVNPSIIIRLYIKIEDLNTLREDMLKIRFKKQKIKIEMNWPTKPKQTKSIGPLYGKIKKNAIQVSRTACLVVISLGKSQRGKWNQLTRKPLEFPADVDELNRIRNERIYRSIEKNRSVDEKNQEIKQSVSGISGNETSMAKAIKSVEKNKKYSHLPFFNRIKRIVGNSVKGNNRNKTVDLELGRVHFEEKCGDQIMSCEYVSVSGSVYSKDTKCSKIKVHKKRDGAQERLKLKTRKLFSNFGKMIKSKSRSRSQLKVGNKALNQRVSRIRSSRQMLKNSKKSSHSFLKRSRTAEKKKFNNHSFRGNKAATERVKKNNTPNKVYRNVKAKVNTFRPTTATPLQNPETPKISFRGKKRGRKKTRPFNGKLSPKTEKSIKKFKKQIPLLKNELKMLLIKDKFSSEDYTSKESCHNLSKFQGTFKNLPKIMKNSKIFKNIENYEEIDKKSKMGVLTQLVEALKDKLMEEQRLRLLRERELEVILSDDNKRVEFLVSFQFLKFFSRKTNWR